jgi:nicotinate phosphoribosyltransferase
MMIEGAYQDFSIFETPALGFMCQSSGIATRTARLKKLVGEKQLISFGIRRIHPKIAYMVDRSAFLGGCDFVSFISTAERLGTEPRGTMPHALSVIMGDSGDAFKAFNKNLPSEIPRIALVDTYSDEIQEALVACEKIPNLEGVRLDTPGSRRGNFPQIIQELRWELDIRGFKNVKIYASGGISENNIKELVEAGADGFGICTTIVNAPVLDIATDIVEKEGKPVSIGSDPGRNFRKPGLSGMQKPV